MKKHSIIKLLTSTRLTVICLVLLIIVVIWGTVYQVENGLYQAQQKFFYSWFVFLFGFFPIPGTVLIFWVLFLNVFSSILFRIPFKFSNLGNILIHVGIMIFFIGSFFTYYYSQESVISLKEEQEKNFSVSSLDWELAIWHDQKEKKVVYAVDTNRLASDDRIKFDQLDMEIQVHQYYKNCIAYVKTKNMDKVDIINSSGIQQLEPKTEKREHSKNMAGMVFSILPFDKNSKQVLLYGADKNSTPILRGGKNYYFSLRKKRFILPFSLRLIDFKRTFHPGSNIVRSYDSKVEVRIKELVREVIISMNKPLRYKNFTLYQSSYFIADDGTEYTFLAVVKNFGKLFPYISSIIIFMGLCIHFLLRLIKKKKNLRE
ncbi:MAG: cytochrome c biogenesis protein ResB [Candidatus Aminicenantes bacterium]|nr:cytochrome c biogenesis protein ResB [Candidatus Aminicenantes bacterium]